MRSLFIRISRFGGDRSGTVAAIFGLSFVPMVMFTGLAVDYGRANTLSAQLQAAVDQAAISGAQLAGDVAAATAVNMVKGAMEKTGLTFDTTASTDPSTKILTVSSTVDMPMKILSMWVPSWTLTRTSKALPGSATITNGTPGINDDSCIFTMGETLTISTNTMTFNGSPSVNLTGCSLRSNKSMKCNGSSTGADSYAVGDIVGCSNPHPGQQAMTDIYTGIASNITLKCGTRQEGVWWNANWSGSLPTGENVKSVSRSGYTEIHICGNLVLSGSSSNWLTGASPSTDTVVVVENGGIVIASGSNVQASRMTFVLASSGGSYNYPIVYWPNGNGGNASSWSVTASTEPTNPWKGMVIYQNPSLNSTADMSWNSGATFSFDDIVYFPNAQLTVSGQVYSGPTGCSKLVVGEFTLNGAVNLKQSSVGCASMQVTQFFQPGTTQVTTAGAVLVQ